MIKIITDSTSDVPEEMLKQYNISVVPLYLNWGNDQYVDRVTITPEQFYERLAKDPVYPSSSQPSEEDFTRAFNKAREEGADEIICLDLSSAMSGTYHMAVSAAAKADIPVHVVDAKGPTMKLGWQVLAAARAVEAGASAQEALAEVARVRERMAQLVAMQSLAPLDKGGRIGNAIRWLGNTLQVKPLIYVDKETGKVTPISLLRTQNALAENLFKKFIEHVKDTRDLRVAVLHGAAPEAAVELAERIERELKPRELLTMVTGPVLGIHTGLGALCICGYSDAR